jgi:hypothetical protein
MDEHAAGDPTPVHPLIAEAMRKAALIWLEVPGRRPVAAWTTWQDDAAYVVHGEGEQPIPGLADAGGCRVLVRSADNGARIVAWPATVSRVEPGSETWATVVPTLLGKRLNLPDPNGAEQRWSVAAVVSRLAPAGEPEADLPTASLAEPPAETPASTQTTVPFTLHRRSGRRRKR